MKPLVVELFCGAFGWSAGWLELGGRAIGFDIEHRSYHGPVPQGAELVLQDVRTLHGAQFKDVALLLCSPPCTEYSFMAMPWSRGKQIAAALRGNGEFPKGYKGSRTIAELNALFDACFRIQREASEAAGRYIPMVVENVKGAQPWVGKARANFGSFYLFGDVDSIGGRIVRRGDIRWGVPSVKSATRGQRKSSEGSWDLTRENYTPDHAWDEGTKVPGLNWSGSDKPDYVARGFNVTAEQRLTADGLKLPGNNGPRLWSEREVQRLADAPLDVREFGLPGEPDPMWPPERIESGLGNNPVNDGVKSRDADGYERDHVHPFDWKAPRTSSHSPKRKQASAKIAMIPFALSSHIALIFKPGCD